MSEKEQMHAIFRGKVQGVCFRATTCQIAKKIGVTGRVKNLSDGSVEVYAQGTKGQLEDLLSGLDQEFGSNNIHDVSTEFTEISQSWRDFNVDF